MKVLVSYIKNGDRRLFYWVNQRLSCWFMDIFMRATTQLGSLGFAILLPVLLYISNRGYLPEIAVRMLILLGISQLVTQIIKRAVNRPRPFRVLDNVLAKNIPSCQYSFPSGHTSAAFALAFALSGGIPGLSLIFYLLASLVALSRIYLGVHYPTDVIVGYFTAYLCQLIV